MSSKKIDYSYKANQGLVLQADRSLIGKREQVEIESLHGKINPKDMGSKVKKIKTKPKERKYQPKTKSTIEIYQLLLSLVKKLLGDVEDEVLGSATDTIIEILHSDNENKRKQIEEIVSLQEQDYVSMLQLSKRLNDYDEQKDENVAFNIESSEDEDQDQVVESEEEEEEEAPQSISEIQKLCGDKYEKAMELLKAENENELVELFDFDYDLVKKIMSQKKAPRVVDLEALAFDQQGHFMSNDKVKLPKGSFKRQKPGYEEIHIPAVENKGSNEKLKKVSEMPEWAQKPFKKDTILNRIQSAVYSTAFLKDDNMLLCAPTGAGKTNCAMLTILHEIGKNLKDDQVDLSAFKIVYIAPMKALVSEVVAGFSKRLELYGIQVKELTGDVSLTKEQISTTQVIVTTPEKWDIITRKAGDTSYTKLVRLVIIDEIHLLHDSRGPVLEAIVSRNLRDQAMGGDAVRLVGLSATLPNYKDVAEFLHVTEDNLFFFNGSYRPCPLVQQYCGISEKSAIKRMALMNEICYEKVLEELTKNQDNQILIFCHSRKECGKTARQIRDQALANDTLATILKSDAASREILTQESQNVQSDELRELLPYGFAIHHAGLSRPDRQLIEDLYADRHIPVLISTATLAWGVNLPAHTVIIKGTQVYNPELGRWCELSSQDMLQMLGRAGRPQFDTFGEGIIITTHQELQYYLSLLNEQLPIESQLISRLPDVMNAEIVLGNINNRQEAIDWLEYTYLYTRMLRNGVLYGVSIDDAEGDPTLIQKRSDFVHSAALALERSHLLQYDRQTGKFAVTDLGRIASYFYITHKSMASYNLYLKPSMTIIDLFRIFAMSEEFKLMPVRAEEKVELKKMLERVPIPVKETMDEPSAKVNVLLQTYISRLKLEGLALMSDMVFVTQSAGRICRAIFEICLKRGWALLAKKALDLCKMVDHRCWLSFSPLRQFKDFPIDLIRKMERKDIPWSSYFEFDVQYLGELVGMPAKGRIIHEAISKFPRIELQPYFQPISRSMLKVEVDVQPIFQYDPKVHSAAETFWVFVEDVDGEVLLFYDRFVLKNRYANDQHTISFTVPLFEPLAPNYYISLVSDRWLHVETRIPILLKNLILPAKYPAPTELLDLAPIAPKALKDKEAESLYNEDFNAVQTQVFANVYGSDQNVLICAPVGAGKLSCAEFALLRMWRQTANGRCVFVCAVEQSLDMYFEKWKKRFSNYSGGKRISKLSGDVAGNLKMLELADIVFCTPEQWDQLSRKWKQRKSVQQVDLFIVNDIHMVGSEGGHVLEIIVSRMRYIKEQVDYPIRIVALGVSLANARDVADWIGATNQNCFNFHPSVRPVPIEIHVQSYNIAHFASLMLAMSKPAYTAITTLGGQESVLVFVPSRKQCKITASEIVNFAIGADQEKRFLHVPEDDISPFLERFDDKSLIPCVKHGVAFYHEALSKNDIRLIDELFSKGAIQIVVANKEVVWGMDLKAKLVVVMGSQYYEGKEHRYVDYPIPDLLQMMGKAIKSRGEPTRCVFMCNVTRKEYFIKFLNESLPIESHLNLGLHDHFNAEIVNKVIENKQDAVDYLTWTFMYRRMSQNPMYYNLQGTTHRHLSDFLSQLVEQTLEELEESKCIEIDEDSVAPFNLGMISSFYYINYNTIKLFSESLRARTRLQVLLDVVASATEYSDIPIRHHEESLLEKIAERLPRKSSNPNYNSPFFKASLLLQSHFSRFQLPPDLESDQKLVLSKVIRLLQACVDFIASNGWLNPALAAMELSQMCVQAMWDKDSPLKQVPHFNSEIIERLNKRGIERPDELMEMESNELNEVLQLDKPSMRDVIKFVNQLPIINVELKIDTKKVIQGEVATLVVELERDMEEDDEELLGPVIAPFYPGRKEEGWWLVVGDVKAKVLLAIKRITLHMKQTVTLEFPAPDSTGNVECRLYLMSDSFVGFDQDFEFELTVEPNEDGDVEMEET